MSAIDVCAYHTMNKTDAQAAADELAQDLSEKFSIDYGWEDDAIHFERPGVHGMITVGEKEIRINAELGFLLVMLKGRIEVEIMSYLEKHFGCTF